MAYVTPAVGGYLRELVTQLDTTEYKLVSLVLFGSVAAGGYSATASDVDLIVVVADDTAAAAKRGAADLVAALEVRHGMGKRRPLARGLSKPLTAFADRVSGNDHACFVCTRADLLSGDAARVLGVPRVQAMFVDRITMSGILGFGRTWWGEDLLSHVPLRPVRRLDVALALYRLMSVLLVVALVYPLLPGATGYAMDMLKHSMHSCYFCYHARSAPLSAKAEFLAARGGGTVLFEMLELRRNKRRSYAFVLRCMPALVRMHWCTARDVRFPVAARDAACTQPA